MNTELSLLKLFLKQSFYKKNNDLLRLDFLRDNDKLLVKLFQCIFSLHDTVSKDVAEFSPQDLLLYYQAQNPTASDNDLQSVSKLVTRLEEIEINEDVGDSLLKAHRGKVAATEIALLGLKVADGKASFEDLQSKIESYRDSTTVPASEGSEFVSDDLDILLARVSPTGGLKWRLGFLNQALGPLHRGDFGFLFARPESGKTTFLASEVTFMAEQLPAETPVLWFNNEEQGEKVLIRCFEAYFGKSFKEISANASSFKQEYYKSLSGRIKIFDSPGIYRKDVDRLCDAFKPGLIIFDQIDKIKGVDEDRHDLEMKVIYQWARELSKKYGPVIGVCQAGGTGEGKKWLTMDDVDSSKTSKQGEADWMLGIGKSNQEGMERTRGFSIVKNKLLGVEVEELRHGKAEVMIIPEIARYAEYRGHQ